MKVCVIVPEQYSPTYGGALATWTYEVYSLLPIDVTVISKPTSDCYNSPKVEFCKSSYLADSLFRVIQNRSVKGLLSSSRTWLRNSFGRRSGQICAKLKPDIIHIHNDPGMVASIKYFNPNSSIVLHMNNDHLLTSGDREVEELSTKVSQIAFCSEFIRENALRKMSYLPKGKTFLIRNGAGKEFHPSRGNKKSNDPVLLFVGRLVPDKGLHVLLDSLNYIFDWHPKVSLRIIGGIDFGSHEQSNYLIDMKRKSAKWGERINFVGPVSRNKISEEFARADLFVCPSIWDDPLPTVNAEAMASGLPIVAFAKGGIPEIVGDAGILVEETTPEALAQAINQVLGDPELYQTLSQKGLQRVKEQFDWDVIAQTWLRELQKLYT